MNDEREDPNELTSHLALEEYCYLTTRGRRTGKPHEIEIWFGMLGRTIYLLSGGGESSDWVRNLIADPQVSVRLGGRSLRGRARLVRDAREESTARPLLAAKYQGWRAGRRMSGWARTARVVAVDLEAGLGLMAG